jgi:hypothetical protein
MATSALVIGVRDAESLIARYRGYAGWSMRKTREMYGSPIRIPTFALKCDGQWLAGKVAEFKARHAKA